MPTYVFIYITMFLIKEYSAEEIIRNVCFTTASEVVKNLNKCGLYLKSAVDILQNGGTNCSSLCHIRMINFESHMNNILRSIIFTIGGNTYKSETCLGLRTNGIHLIINCSSPKYDEYGLWHTQDCQKRNAQCIKLKTTCICQCLPGYFVVEDICSIRMSVENQTRFDGEKQGSNLNVNKEISTRFGKTVSIASRTSIDGHQQEPIDLTNNGRTLECDVNMYPRDYNKQIQENRNINHLPSNDGPVDSSIYSSVFDISMEDCKKDDEYNHLHERRNTDDHDDEYDHAGLLLCNETYSDLKRNCLCVDSEYATTAEII